MFRSGNGILEWDSLPDTAKTTQHVECCLHISSLIPMFRSGNGILEWDSLPDTAKSKGRGEGLP